MGAILIVAAASLFLYRYYFCTFCEKLIDGRDCGTDTPRMPIAQTKGPELIKRLNAMRYGSHDEFSLRAIQRDAERLKFVNAYEAYMILGVVACLRGDQEAMHEAHQKAIKRVPHDPIAYINYATSLMNTGQITGAIDQAKQACAVAPHDPDALNNLVALLKNIGRYREAFALLNDLRKVSPEQCESLSTVIVEGKQLLETFGISDDERQEVAQWAAMILQRNNASVAIPRTTFLLNEGGDKPGIATVFHVVDASPETVVDMNEQFAESIIEANNPAVKEHILVRFTGAPHAHTTQ